MDAQVQHRTDQDLGGAPEGLDALVVAERLKAGGVGLFLFGLFSLLSAFSSDIDQLLVLRLLTGLGLAANLVLVLLQRRLCRWADVQR